MEFYYSNFLMFESLHSKEIYCEHMNAQKCEFTEYT